MKRSIIGIIGSQLFNLYGIGLLFVYFYTYQIEFSFISIGFFCFSTLFIVVAIIDLIKEEKIKENKNG